MIRADQSGEFWNFIIGGIVGGVIGGVVAIINGEDLAGVITNIVAGAASGVVAASGLGLISQAGISAGISAAADFVNQTVDIVKSNGSISDYDFMRTANEAILGFGASATGSVLGKLIDTNATKAFSKSQGAFDRYLGKQFAIGFRTEAGRSTSALSRQANKFLKQSDFYLNVYRGISSVVGSGISFFNIFR